MVDKQENFRTDAMMVSVDGGMLTFVFFSSSTSTQK